MTGEVYSVALNLGEVLQRLTDDSKLALTHVLERDCSAQSIRDYAVSSGGAQRAMLLASGWAWFARLGSEG